ncbi:hypothetical protein AAMO2058_000506800 [Amorphochlora amoebiformis]
MAGHTRKDEIDPVASAAAPPGNDHKRAARGRRKAGGVVNPSSEATKAPGGKRGLSHGRTTSGANQGAGGKGKRSAAAFIKAKVQSALKKRAKEKITLSSLVAQNSHVVFTAGFCVIAIVVAALMKVKDISPGALRKEISAYKSQNSVLKNEVNLVHQENAVLYNRILTLHNHLMRASSQYTRWHTALNEDLIKEGEEQIRPYTAVVPDGVTPGSGFEVVVDGQIYLVLCPKGGKPGDTVAFDLLAQVLSQVVDGGLVNAETRSTAQASNLEKSWTVVSERTNISRLSHQLASPRIHWIRMRNSQLPKLVNQVAGSAMEDGLVTSNTNATSSDATISAE